jgi:hypothetical protein
MGKYDKLLAKILRGTSDANISFSEPCQLLKKFDFDERIRGDHHIFTRDDIDEILNLQPKASKAKPYQVKQVRTLIFRYKLELEEKGEK